VSSKILAVLGGLATLAACSLRFVATGRRNAGVLRNGSGRMKSPPSDVAQLRPEAGMPAKPKTSFRVSGLTKTEAEDLLDWLENQGVDGCQVEEIKGQGFTVWHD
jgi:hypothetical protein